MIIHGTPNEIVTDGRSKRLPRPILFRFDSEGLYRTDNADIIKRAKPFFRVTDEDFHQFIQDNSEKIKEISDKNIAEEKENAKNAISYTCKKCGAIFDNRGAFLMHHRKDHGKGD